MQAMTKVQRLGWAWRALLKDESAQDLVEYALVALFLALVIVASVQGLSTKIAATYSYINDSIASAL